MYACILRQQIMLKAARSTHTHTPARSFMQGSQNRHSHGGVLGTQPILCTALCLAPALVLQLQQPLPVLPPVNPRLLPTPSAERLLAGSSSSSSAYQQLPTPAPMPAAATPVDPSLLRSPSAAAAAAAHAQLVLQNGMVPPSPLPQHKVQMPNSADKLADTGKVSSSAVQARR